MTADKITSRYINCQNSQAGQEKGVFFLIVPTSKSTHIYHATENIGHFQTVSS